MIIIYVKLYFDLHEAEIEFNPKDIISNLYPGTLKLRGHFK